MVERHVAPYLSTAVDRQDRLDHKTALQERCAQLGLAAPTYRLTSVGPDHAKVFTATVIVERAPIGSGVGGSKKSAEQAAALAALSDFAERDA